MFRIYENYLPRVTMLEHGAIGKCMIALGGILFRACAQTTSTIACFLRNRVARRITHLKVNSTKLSQR